MVAKHRGHGVDPVLVEDSSQEVRIIPRVPGRHTR
jgi:hypothetical protein